MMWKLRICNWRNRLSFNPLQSTERSKVSLYWSWSWTGEIVSCEIWGKKTLALDWEWSKSELLPHNTSLSFFHHPTLRGISTTIARCYITSSTYWGTREHTRYARTMRQTLRLIRIRCVCMKTILEMIRKFTIIISLTLYATTVLPRKLTTQCKAAIILLKLFSTVTGERTAVQLWFSNPQASSKSWIVAWGTLPGLVWR